ncbi:MAG: magnesium chelatase, partial [Candidatus Methanomethylicia archaeon]
VRIPEKLLEVISRLCIKLSVDGHRPDITILKTSKALAAFEGLKEVKLEHITTCAKLTLSHRTRRGGLEEPATPQQIEQAIKEAISEAKLLEAPQTIPQK